ncbi:histidinol-phosphatase HisJ [Falsibacillus albus]|uniref:Histidinol-phosphatase n=1 Tax=Falsibacillus albus TaxID=2478915 RepID=A0A3L7K6M4_9BACI|nr:histidinol-phosphatase HisJ [Falsibacillus albus]RLQ97924.1 histidinol-phosphatase HisJ [Falsibacillus albus]
MLRDGHIHSPYCPHGTNDAFKKYIERAIELGYKDISFTEHAPLPDSFIDTTPTKDSGMDKGKLEKYLKELDSLKEEYKKDLFIRTGLEVDFIEGFENETEKLLNEYGPFLDDSILSVHFLKHENDWYCVDYSPEFFSTMVEVFGSAEAIYDTYYNTIHLSIMSDLGKWKPIRIGHMTLAQKFQKKFPAKNVNHKLIDNILREIKKHRYQLDYNGAGIVKPFCQESYPNKWIAEEAAKMGIPLIYGSDAHQAADLNQGRTDLMEHIIT